MNPFFFVAAGVMILPLLLLWYQWRKYGRLWLQAHLAGTHVSLFDLIGMTLRKVDAAKVVKCHIQFHQGGCSVSLRELESAYLQGANIDNITMAALAAKNRDMELSFQQLVATDLEGQLARTLGIAPEEMKDPNAK